MRKTMQSLWGLMHRKYWRWGRKSKVRRDHLRTRMNRFKLYPIGNCDPLSPLKTRSNLGYKYVSDRKVE